MAHVRTFNWLLQTFNGDLFPQTELELQSVNTQHLDILQRFLSGHVMDHYPDTQIGLWPYSFKIVPIELISSIYEMFAHGEDSERAETQSVHYTRLCLVELMLSLAMTGNGGHRPRLRPCLRVWGLSGGSVPAVGLGQSKEAPKTTDQRRTS